jgi:hypothetical protein
MPRTKSSTTRAAFSDSLFGAKGKSGTTRQRGLVQSTSGFENAGPTSIQQEEKRTMMMKTIATIACALLGATAAAQAAPAADAPSKPRSAQQQKMATCNKDATGKKGAERKTFMKACLSKKAGA